MRAVYLHDLASALGEQRFTVEQSARAGRTLSAATALREAGFAHHHVCAPESTSLTLASRATEEFVDKLSPPSAIVYATCLPMNGSLQCEAGGGDVRPLMDFPASRLQAALGLPGAAVFGLTQQACTVTLGAIRTARALIASDPDVEQVLCVTADRFPPGARYEQAYNLISDGAAACLVSPRPMGFRILACHQRTNGALVQVSDEETTGVYFPFTCQTIRESLAKAGLELEEIDWIVPQNMNRKAWQILSRLLRIPEERIFLESLADVGHVIAADNLINLQRLAASGDLRRGARLLLVMTGYGMNCQCLVLEAL